jgi:hypothetical protein
VIFRLILVFWFCKVWQADLGAKAGKRPGVILTREDVSPFLTQLTVAEITSQRM